MADKSYYNATQEDGTAAEAAKHTTTITVTVPDGHASNPPANVAACAGPYYPGNAKAVLLLSTGDGVEFWMNGSGGSGGAAVTVMRELTMPGEYQGATNTLVGVINEETMPHEFYLYDTAVGGSGNVCTMYFIY